MVKSGLISGGGGHIRAGYENMAGFWPGLDMISGATLFVCHKDKCKYSKQSQTDNTWISQHHRCSTGQDK